MLLNLLFESVFLALIQPMTLFLPQEHLKGNKKLCVGVFVYVTVGLDTWILYYFVYFR